LRVRNPTHDNNLEGRVKRNNGPVQPRGKIRLFPLPKDKKLPWIMRKSFLAKARTKKNFCRSLNLFALGALPLHLWSAFNGSGGTEVRARSAVGTKGWIDLGTFFPGGYGLQGADFQAVPAAGAFFGNLVGHKDSYQRSAISFQQTGFG
jgi:hypothetical protein